MTLPDNSTLTSTQRGSLPLKNLSAKATETTILDNLKSSSLISLGQLCDDDCKIYANKQHLMVMKDSKLILKGQRNKHDGLWDIPIPQPIPPSKKLPIITKSQLHNHHLNVIIRKNQTKQDLVRYLYAACFSPVPSTIVKAIKNNHFSTWPSLTTNLITKTLPKCIESAKGHLNQERQNLQTTKINLQPIKIEDEDNVTFPTSDSPNVKTRDVCYTIVQMDDTKAYLDLTGKFPFQSSRGNNYILVAYHHDANAILAEAIKNRGAETITAGWKLINEKCEKAGIQPNTYIIDNEASKELKKAMEKKNINHKLVPPHMHRTNLAERAIQTFKNHFKAGLATVDPDFPSAEWDRLLPQALLTLNLLRTARVNPNLSAQAYLFGEFNFNATPLVPPGTRVLVHKKTDDRTSWGPHGREGWYIGPSLHHYRCVRCFIPETRAEVDCDTVEFFPTNIPFPAVKTDDYLKQALTDIVSILTKPPPSTVPSLEAGDETRNAILKIATALNRIDPTPSTLPDTEPTAVPENLTVIIPPSTIATTPNPPQDIQPAEVTVPTSKPTTSVPRVEKTKANLHIKPRRNPLNSKEPYLQQRYGLRSNTQAKNYSHNFRHNAARHLLAQHLVSKIVDDDNSLLEPQVMHIYNEAGKKETVDSLMSGPDKDIWIKSMSNELGRLAQGNKHGIKATDTIDFISKTEVPSDSKVTYANFRCDYRPLKSEKHRIRLVVGGDKLSYEDDSGSPAASLLETKVMVNSVISDAHKGARFMSCDLKDFFLATPMLKPEYMRIMWKHIPEDIREKYDLYKLLADDGYIYVKIKRGMYGLKQAAVLAYDHLIANLANHGYRPVPHTLGIWEHKTRRTKFCLCVDDFGIKYFNKDDADHLITTLSKYYTCTTDWPGKNFCGLQLDWNYDKGYVDISMPNYVRDCLVRFQHDLPPKLQHSPHQHTPIQYGSKGTRQYAKNEDTSALLDKKGIKFVQSVTGSLLYYARAIDGTMLPALNEIASQQAKPTVQTKFKCLRLLDYAATYQNAFVRFYASDMVLTVDTDAAYLVLPKARSRVAGYFYLGNFPKSKPHPSLNGAILIECKSLRHVVASAAEAEAGGIFHNCQMAIPIRNMLINLGHPQPPTPIKTDNSTANSFVHDNINLKKSKSWDMRYYWLRDRINQSQFNIYWAPGKINDADYFTKHHAIIHHKATRARYVRDHLNYIKEKIAAIFTPSGQTLWARGCVDPLDIPPPKMTSQLAQTPVGTEQDNRYTWNSWRRELQWLLGQLQSVQYRYT